MTFIKGTRQVPGNRIRCDALDGVEPGTLRSITCAEEFAASHPKARLGSDAAGLREAARELGWQRNRIRGGAEDLCPRHAIVKPGRGGWRQEATRRDGHR